MHIIMSVMRIVLFAHALGVIFVLITARIIHGGFIGDITSNHFDSIHDIIGIISSYSLIIYFFVRIRSFSFFKN